jgi:asparagine synthetase B (glutamine-hydrolysing)
VHLYGWRYFLQQAVLPAFPPLRRVLGALRGRPIRDPDAFEPPSWLSAEFRERYQLDERERRWRPKYHGKGLAAATCFECLTHPAFGVVREPLGAFTVEGGVELRIPLFDERIVRFVVPRPFEERLSGMESKRLLREAARPLLPEAVVAPRKNRTGMTGGYFDRWMRREYPVWINDLLDAPVLESCGVVHAEELRRAWQEYQETGNNGLGTKLYATFDTELWLRARRDSVPSTPQAVVSTPRREASISAD